MHEAEGNFIPLDYTGPSTEESIEQSERHYRFMDRRRSVRHFSDRAVPKEVIENIIKAASTAPSGAHKQPWMFCVVSDPEVKKEIREKAEKEEYQNYHGRMSEGWLKDLEPFATDWNKEFIEIAPYLIVVFKQVQGEDGEQHYYVNESAGIAAGMLISAIHHAGLVTLTHTPSPMKFLNEILDRPRSEKPFLLMPVGYPDEGAEVPDLTRKPLDKVSRWY